MTATLTRPAPLTLPGWLRETSATDAEASDLLEALSEVGARPRQPGGLIGAARRYGLPLRLHTIAARVAADYVTARDAREAEILEHRLTAREEAAVTDVRPSRDGGHLVYAECARCGRTVQHGGGPVDGPVDLGHRTAHCECSDYFLVDPNGVVAALGLTASPEA
ncbi:hypothetical protein [Aquipuribacter sp. SD81]|uniref:hypothetical protein n=1 Tax=Aquipuribacter sp. SD81 TaxID=3127703 RepID=UPI003019265B